MIMFSYNCSLFGSVLFFGKDNKAYHVPDFFALPLVCYRDPDHVLPTPLLPVSDAVTNLCLLARSLRPAGSCRVPGGGPRTTAAASTVTAAACRPGHGQGRQGPQQAGQAGGQALRVPALRQGLPARPVALAALQVRVRPGRYLPVPALRPSQQAARAPARPHPAPAWVQARR